MSKLCKEATLTRAQIQSDQAKTPSLCEFLTHVNRETGSSVQGLAFATNGSWPILGLDDVSSAEAPKLCIRPIEGRDFDEDKAFELRLWVPTLQAHNPADGDVLAREYRWVNGVCAVELRVTSGRPKTSSEVTESVSVSGWFHKVSYLQHESTATRKEESAPDTSTGQTKQSKQDTATNDMSALEFIQEEDKYGNTVVVDQLFTGEWGR